MHFSGKAATEVAPDYGCMLDAGSTGTRIHVYQFGTRENGVRYVVREVFEQLKPGVSSYADDPNKAGESIAPLLEVCRRDVAAIWARLLFCSTVI